MLKVTMPKIISKTSLNTNIVATFTEFPQNLPTRKMWSVFTFFLEHPNVELITKNINKQQKQ